MKRSLALALLVPLLAASSARADDLVPGTWKITTLSVNGAFELTFWVLKLDSADGKTMATLASANPNYKNPKLKSFTVKDGAVRAVLYGFNEQVFEGKLAQDGKKVVGTIGTQEFPMPAWMEPTEVTELDKSNIQKPAGDAGAGMKALFKVRTAKKDAAAADLAKWADVATKDAVLYGPAWQLNVYSLLANALVRIPSQTPLAVKYAELADKALPATASPARHISVLETLARAQRAAGKSDAAMKVMGRVATYAEEIEKALPASTLPAQRIKALETVAHAHKAAGNASAAEEAMAKVATLAEAAEKALPASASPAQRIKALETLAHAHEEAGNGRAAFHVMERVWKLDATLDKEYIAAGLPFKPEPFAGRKTDSKRVVVLEMFTGAQCPPCVAADLAFDGLLQTFKPTELVLVQYHQHIPGPDPLTNGETEARWSHYQKAFAPTGKQLGGVPTAILNGSKDLVGGGPLAFAEKTYANYRRIIDPLLETPAACTINATAKRVGDKINILADVTGLENASPNKKLRLLLLEESVHYGGGNKIRIHHHVVRAMPGGVNGKAITDKNFKTTASVDVPALRKTLTSYLDTFVSDNGPFPRYIRPMEMRDMRVVALVQDDATNEILNALQVNVEP